jgi:hypothetical protein
VLNFAVYLQRPGAVAHNAQSMDDLQQSVSAVALPTDTSVDQRLDQLQLSEEPVVQNNPPPQRPPPGLAPPQPEIIPENVQWFYTDPAGQQQGEDEPQPPPKLDLT